MLSRAFQMWSSVTVYEHTLSSPLRLIPLMELELQASDSRGFFQSTTIWFKFSMKHLLDILNKASEGFSGFLIAFKHFIPDSNEVLFLLHRGWDEIELVATETVVEQGTEFSQGFLVKMKLLRETWLGLCLKGFSQAACVCCISRVLSLTLSSSFLEQRLQWDHEQAEQGKCVRGRALVTAQRCAAFTHPHFEDLVTLYFQRRHAVMVQVYTYCS